MLVVRGPEDGVLRLTLHRPDRLNALTQALVDELVEAAGKAMAQDAVRVLLIDGDGRSFCAGKDRDEPATEELVESLQALASTLMNGPKPVVAAVQGWAVGAGLELLLNCDIVIAAASAQFKLPEVGAGLFGTGGVLALLPRTIGLAKSRGALLLGEPFTAQQADAWGLLWQVVDDELLQRHALRVATQLAMGDAAVLAQTKSLLHREAFGELAAVLEREAEAHRKLAGR